MEDARSESKVSPTGRSLVRSLFPGLRQTAAHSSAPPSGAALGCGGSSETALRKKDKWASRGPMS